MSTAAFEDPPQTDRFSGESPTTVIRLSSSAEHLLECAEQEPNYATTVVRGALLDTGATSNFIQRSFLPTGTEVIPWSLRDHGGPSFVGVLGKPFKTDGTCRLYAMLAGRPPVELTFVVNHGISDRVILGIPAIQALGVTIDVKSRTIRFASGGAAVDYV